MVKVGDKVVVVSVEPGNDLSVGDMLVVKVVNNPYVFWAVSEIGIETYARTEEMDGSSTVIVRPYTESEAEKRGAKFGTMGVNKVTGQKWVFGKEVGSIWWGMNDDGFFDSGVADAFRLDHEPEYKKIPFRNATDSQRLNIDNIYGSGGKRPIEALKTAGGYYVYTFSENVGPTMVNSNGGSGIEIRIPV